MKVLWIIYRLDGTIARIIREQAAAPVPGDGAHIDGIPIAIGSVITTPMAGDLDQHDLAVAAKEQRY
jgi:hypothetical protein